MVLDTATLRVAFAVMALVLGLLFYFSVYRSTRSAYSAWWCFALIMFLAGSASLLLEGTPLQWLAIPAGHGLLVAGASSVWAAARSLRTSMPRPWLLLAGPVITAFASCLENPAGNTWSGGAVFLASMSVVIGLAAHELWHLEPGYSKIRMPMAMAAGSLSLFYFLRLIVYLVEGPYGPNFQAYFGSALTTCITMVLLVVASFSMAALSTEQQTRALRTFATRDGLTGLLNRGGFLDLAEAELLRLQRTRAPGTLLLADLDHFKAINDTHGHAAGDRALQAFAKACTQTVRSSDLVARYGGEEFVLLLPGVSPYRGESVATDISRRMDAASADLGIQMPTVSYGLAAVDDDTEGLEELIAAADAALYRAKSLGRNRTVRYARSTKPGPREPDPSRPER
ncbi:GGDEF domain-containing protein [Arthrobacter sp.]|uniref:GGDEF domain-containing protein n=1 Tax=Arthrobacter sp. TaxID=1667 RepID=UPI002812339F|nr:GGDEF domain-containing protein [Arthrobacter sp.]